MTQNIAKTQNPTLAFARSNTAATGGLKWLLGHFYKATTLKWSNKMTPMDV